MHRLVLLSIRAQVRLVLLVQAKEFETLIRSRTLEVLNNFE